MFGTEERQKLGKRNQDFHATELVAEADVEPCRASDLYRQSDLRPANKAFPVVCRLLLWDKALLSDPGNRLCLPSTFRKTSAA